MHLVLRSLLNQFIAFCFPSPNHVSKDQYSPGKENVFTNFFGFSDTYHRKNTGCADYTQSPLIRTTAKLPTLGVLKNSSNLDAHWFLIPQV
jgi:hypothetical protein